MPHSSGGGSSSGGSHGNHRDRYIRRRPFAKASKFIRYKKDGDIEVAYSRRPINLLSKGVNYIGLIIAAFLTFGAGSICVDTFKYPEKLDVNAYQSEVFISDPYGMIDNVQKLGKRLDEFQDLTGITICVKAVKTDEWKDYSRLEDYAYDDYLKTFKDEKHWLLVYSEGKVKGKTEWYWEGMQGDLTDPILTTHFTDKFTKEVQKHLEDGESFDEAVIAGLDKISPKIMKSIDFSMVFASFLLIGIILWCTYSFCIEGRTGNKTRYIKVPNTDEDPKMTKCYTCGNSYITDSVPVCPYCYNVSRYKWDPFYRNKVQNETDMYK